jgi:hypothetical protein
VLGLFFSSLVDFLQLLLSSGADPTAKNAFHLTPLEVTTAEDVREVLRRAMTRAAAQTPSSSSSSAALMVSAQHQAAAQQARDVERKALSLSLRTAANRLKDALQQPLPSTLEEEAARLVELEAVRAAAIATNGLVILMFFIFRTIGFAFRLRLSFQKKKMSASALVRLFMICARTMTYSPRRFYMCCAERLPPLCCFTFLHSFLRLRIPFSLFVSFFWSSRWTKRSSTMRAPKWHYLS